MGHLLNSFVVFPDFLPECLFETSLISTGDDFFFQLFVLLLEMMDLLLEDLNFRLCPAVLEILEYLVHVESVI